MGHLDPDRLALLAVEQHEPGPGESTHLDECRTCAAELRALAAVAAQVRGSASEGAPPAPHPRVWEAVAAELGLDRRTRRERRRPSVD